MHDGKIAKRVSGSILKVGVIVLVNGLLSRRRFLLSLGDGAMSWILALHDGGRCYHSSSEST